MPADLPAEVQHDIEETVGRALQTLGVCFGLFHVELWLTDDGIVLGELHGRLGGDYIHRLLAFAIPGVAMFGRVMDDALGRPSPPFDGRCVRGAATRYLTPPPGRVLAIEGWDEASAHPAVIVHELRVGPGDTIVPPRSSDDRVGALVVGGDTAREAGQLADRLAASVRFVVDE
jgi:biotin carboxylase